MEQQKQSRISSWLSGAPAWQFSIYAMGFAFATYFCMYAFRKPFGAATFEGMEFLWGIKLKTAFVIGQIIGYTLSKYYGCKYCSEIGRSQQAKALVLMIVTAEAALLAFALLPGNLKVLAIFINGLPLGMVWGLVSRYLEGRKTAELLFAGLSCSYIVASSSVKTIGGWVMQVGVPEFWMPAAVGGIFFLPFVIAVFFLNQLPDPSTADISSRSERTVMDSSDRSTFFRQFMGGMVMLLLLYFFLTAYRDVRDMYMPEVFKDLGYPPEPTLFSKADYPIAFGIMVVMALLNLAKDHRRGLTAVFAVMMSGMLLMGGATVLMDLKVINGLWWMILVGFGAYLAYVPFGAVLFERIMASTKAAGTAVFAIYLSDAIGYTGSVGVQLYKDLGQSELDYYQFLRFFTYGIAGLGTVLFAMSGVYFLAKAKAAAMEAAAKEKSD
tara:strand:- start:2991 stop:4307 length:1317 start_codon:yes stop_codon:yes gene_type:complete